MRFTRRRETSASTQIRLFTVRRPCSEIHPVRPFGRHGRTTCAQRPSGEVLTAQSQVVVPSDVRPGSWPAIGPFGLERTTAPFWASTSVNASSRRRAGGRGRTALVAAWRRGATCTPTGCADAGAGVATARTAAASRRIARPIAPMQFGTCMRVLEQDASEGGGRGRYTGGNPRPGAHHGQAPDIGRAGGDRDCGRRSHASLHADAPARLQAHSRVPRARRRLRHLVSRQKTTNYRNLGGAYPQTG
jgi:hypothetical protein